LGTMPTIRDMSNDILFYVIISESLGASVSVSTAGRNRNASFLGRLWNTDGKLDGREFTLTLFEGNFSAEMKRRDELRSRFSRDQNPVEPTIVPDGAIGAIEVTSRMEATNCFGPAA